MKIKNAFLFLILISLFHSAFSQKLPFKFGKVSDEELEMKECSFYPEASSMIISEYGDLNFIYANDKGWRYQMDVAVRKKIFKITDADQGNVKIRVYEPEKGTSKEEISSLKAYTHNLVNGKAEREKVDNKEYFTKRLNEYMVEISFAIPNIQEGTVIEYSYTKTSDYTYNLSTWYFQSDIPSAHSEFRYTIPEYFHYQTSQLGNIYKSESDTKNRRETFTYKWEALPGAGGAVNKGTGTLESNSQWNQLILKEIPPIEDEPYMNNRSNLPSRVEFQLVSTKYPNSGMKIVAGNYGKFNEELNTHSAFGDRLNNGRFARDIEAGLSTKSQLQKATGIYDHITNHFSWNKVYTFLSSTAGRPAYNDKEGDIADINLSMIAAFREFGFEAYPVILSTRGHGTVHPVYPSYQDFNYVIGAVKVDDNIYLCDATSRLPFGQLPIRCRNGNGWLVNENGGQWINLKTDALFSETVVFTIDIDENEILTHVSKRDVGYAAYNIIKEIESDSKDEYFKSISSNFSDAEIKNIEISESDLSEPLTMEFDIVKPREGEGILYIQPILMGTIKENPFKREQRLSPVDFPYQQSYKVISQITIPEGYTAELPEPGIFKLPDNKGSFMFNLTQMGNKINVVSNLAINHTDFSTLDYPALRKFYQIVADKNQELIVLSK